MTTLLRWQVGEVRITRVQELEAGGIRFVLPDATAEALGAIPWIGPYVDERGEALGSVHSLVLEVGERRILVDTCIGNDKPRLPLKLWHMRRGRFLDELGDAGFPPERIDTVVCTHLHTDHVGWNTRLVDGRWVPTFPQARTLVARSEWEHWRRDDEAVMRATIADSVTPLFDAGLVDLVETDHEVADGVHLEPTPGHTPGHVCVRIRSRGEAAVVTGDIVHHPAQFARPEWGSSADDDPALAEATRRAFMADVADTPTLVIGTHFAGPTAGRLVRDGNVYRLDDAHPGGHGQ